MKTLKTMTGVCIWLFCLAAFAQNNNSNPPPTGAQNPNSISTVLPLEKSIIKEIVDAAKDAGKKPKSIPFEIAKKVAISKIYDGIGNYMREFHMCDLFKQWAASVKTGATHYLSIEFILVEEGKTQDDNSPVVVVEFFAIKQGQNTPTAASSQSYGYMAPVNGNGNVTTEYDLFGDGSYILKRLDCVAN